MAGEITGSKCKAASSVLLNGHVVKLFPKYLSIPIDQCCPQSWVEKLHFYSKWWLMQKLVTKVMRVSDCRMPSSKQDTGITPKFREHCRRDLKNLRAGQKGGLKDAVFWIWHSLCIQELTAAAGVCTEPAQDWAKERSAKYGKRTQRTSSFPWELLAVMAA